MTQWFSNLFSRKDQPGAEESYLESFFTGAEDIQEIFHNLVSEQKLSKRLLVIHGLGGVGKSTLLRILRLFCKRRQLPIALISLEHVENQIDVLSSWVEELEQGDLTLRQFSTTLQRYRLIQIKIEQQAKKAESVASKFGKTTVKAVVETAISTIPVVGPLANTIGSIGTDVFFEWLQGFLSKQELELYRNPVKLLTEAFLTDVAKVAAKQRLVLMLDTYEQIVSLDKDANERVDTLDQWVVNLVRMLSPNVLVVIAGRGVPINNWERAWPGWMMQAYAIELKPMEEGELKTLVSRYYRQVLGQDPNPKTVEAIVHFSSGLPLLAATAASLSVWHTAKDFEDVKAEVVSTVVERLLEKMPEKLRLIVEAASILRWFDQSVLEAVVDLEISETSYKELWTFPFVRSAVIGKLAIHVVIQNIIDLNLQIQDPQRYEIWHERAASYFETTAIVADRKDQEQLFLEQIYHLIRANKKTLAINKSQEAIDKAYRYYQVLVGESIVSLLDKELKDEHHRHWLVYLRYLGTLLNPDITEQVEKARDLVALIDRFDLEPRLKGLIAIILSEIPEEVNIPLERRIRLLNQAVNSEGLLPHEIAGAHIALGNLLSGQKLEWELVIDHYQRADALYQSENDLFGKVCVQERTGYAYLLMGEWNNCLAFVLRYIDLARTIGGTVLAEALKQLGWVYTYRGELNLALVNIQESLQLARALQDEANIIRISRRLAEIYDKQQRWELSTSLYEQLIDQDEKLNRKISKATLLALLGISYSKQGLYEQAEELLLKSIEYIEPSVAPFAYLGLSDLYLKLKQLDKVEFYIQQGRFVSRGRPYYEARTMLEKLKLDVALGDFKRLPNQIGEIEAISKHQLYYDTLSVLRLMQGHLTLSQFSDGKKSTFKKALRYYQEALIYSLTYNCFLLDEVLWGGNLSTFLQPITLHCLEQGREGHKMLIALLNWWETDLYRNPLSVNTVTESALVDTEHIARQKEAVAESSQATVIGQIENALNKVAQV